MTDIVKDGLVGCGTFGGDGRSGGDLEVVSVSVHVHAHEHVYVRFLDASGVGNSLV